MSAATLAIGRDLLVLHPPGRRGRRQSIEPITISFSAMPLSLALEEMLRRGVEAGSFRSGISIELGLDHARVGAVPLPPGSPVPGGEAAETIAAEWMRAMEGDEEGWKIRWQSMSTPAGMLVVAARASIVEDVRSAASRNGVRIHAIHPAPVAQVRRALPRLPQDCIIHWREHQADGFPVARLALLHVRHSAIAATWRGFMPAHDLAQTGDQIARFQAAYGATTSTVETISWPAAENPA